jgi:hypothetical protein
MIGKSSENYNNPDIGRRQTWRRFRFWGAVHRKDCHAFEKRMKNLIMAWNSVLAPI